MAEEALVDRLAQHRTLSVVPREELRWLAAHGKLVTVRVHDDVTRNQEAIDQLIIVLSGRIVIYVDHGLGPRKVLEWKAGDVTGYLPYSRMGKSPGSGVVEETAELFEMHRDHMPELIQKCPTITMVLVHAMLDRARVFKSSDLQDEKMMSLGRVSAGLAHELNNPASAAARSAKLLADGLVELEDASRALGAARLTVAQQESIDRRRQLCVMPTAPMRSPIERADREDALTAWLEAHDADPGFAATLVDTALTTADLDELAGALDGPVVTAALRWLTADCSTRMLTAEVERAVSRVHDLVASVKRYTHMDRTNVAEPVDVATGIGDSIALLQYKTRKKSVSITVNLERGLPKVYASPGDLNQVWMNLIDNAIDAVPEAGHVTIDADRQSDAVLVRVTDDGAGIPDAIRERIFEPFFTTKPVGQGTGLGLDIVRRLLWNNGGDVDVESRPGRTEFRVTLRTAP